jgi:protein-tyrosine-phosphatase
MNEETKKKLEAAIVACAEKATTANNAIDAMQWTQAAVNASNVIIGLEHNARQKG